MCIVLCRTHWNKLRRFNCLKKKKIGHIQVFWWCMVLMVDFVLGIYIKKFQILCFNQNLDRQKNWGLSMKSQHQEFNQQLLIIMIKSFNHLTFQFKIYKKKAKLIKKTLQTCSIKFNHQWPHLLVVQHLKNNNHFQIQVITISLKMIHKMNLKLSLNAPKLKK